MHSDRNQLFAAFCLQTGRIDSDQFTAVCSERINGLLADVLVERGWIQKADRPHLDYLANQYLQTHDGNYRAAIAQLLVNARRSVYALEALAPDSTIAYSPACSAKSEVNDTEVASSGSRYAFSSVHAVGGMGRVWLADDEQLKREVALKELRPDHAHNSKTAARFVREALLTAQLEHPGIVPVYELTTRTGTTQPFYAMRFVRGGTLSEAIHAYHAKRAAGQASSLELVRLLTAFTAVCNTIAYAHSRGVIHRDLKGDNVILGDFGEVIVLDWGVAKHVDHAADDYTTGATDLEAAHPGLTLQGEIIGTPAYMAPEQAEGRLDDIDERTDVYGLGAMLYEILTGTPPFVGERTIDVLQQAMRGNPKSPRERWPEVPAGLEEICLKAMAREAEARYARADELGQAVQHWQDVQRRRAEEALRRQSEILKSILNSMSEGVVVSDDAGKVLLVNAAAERMLGLSAAAPSASQGGAKYFKSDGVTQFDPKDFPLTRAMQGNDVDDVEMVIRSATKVGGFWASANARPLRDEAGALRGGVVVFRDITERKQVENELIRSRERFELAVRGSQDGLWDWDPQTGEIYYSPQWKAILGYDDHEIGQRIEEWEQRLHPDDRERVIAANQDHIDGATSHYHCEYRLRHKDGSYRWILARGVALRDVNGTAYRIAGSHVDITDRKRAEKRERVC